QNHWQNLDVLTRHDEVKFVVKDRIDYEFAREVITRHDLPSRVAAVLLSPVHGVLDPKTLSEWMLADHLPARLQLQLHKFIWSPETRGVRRRHTINAVTRLPHYPITRLPNEVRHPAEWRPRFVYGRGDRPIGRVRPLRPHD